MNARMSLRRQEKRRSLMIRWGVVVAVIAVIALVVGEHQPHRQQHQQQRGQAQATDADLSGVGIDVVTVHAGRRVRTGRWTDSCPSRAPGLQSKL